MNLKNIRNEQFYQRLDSWSDSLDQFADSYHRFLTEKVDMITKYIESFGDWFLDLLQPFNDFLMEHYKKARYLTLPLHWIWIYLWTYFQSYDDEIDPTNKVGVHYVQALAGGGKSTFMWQKMKDYADKTGKCSYVTTKMEKVKYDDLGQAYLNHIYFQPSEFYGLKNKDDTFGSQLKYFDNELATALIFDEMHVLNNNRNNRTSAYNHIFGPLITSFVLQRHRKFPWIIIGSQMPKNDIQIMSNLTSYNKVQIKKGFIYKKWLEDGKFIRRIKGWRVMSYEVANDKDYLKLESRKRWFKKATVDFSDFETLNMSQLDPNTPVDRRELL